MYSAYWRRTAHYDSPACFSCSIVSFEGSGFFSCVSVFFNFDLSNFSISAISGLSDMVAEDAERSARRSKNGLRRDCCRMPNGARHAPLYRRFYVNEVTSPARRLTPSRRAAELRPGAGLALAHLLPNPQGTVTATTAEK